VYTHLDYDTTTPKPEWADRFYKLPKPVQELMYTNECCGCMGFSLEQAEKFVEEYEEEYAFPESECS